MKIYCDYDWQSHCFFAPRRSKYSKAKQDSDEEKHLHQGNSQLTLHLHTL